MALVCILGKVGSYTEQSASMPCEVEVTLNEYTRQHLHTGGHIGIDIVTITVLSKGLPLQIENLLSRSIAAITRVVLGHRGLIAARRGTRSRGLLRLERSLFPSGPCRVPRGWNGGVSSR